MIDVFDGAETVAGVVFFIQRYFDGMIHLLLPVSALGRCVLQNGEEDCKDQKLSQSSWS